MTRPTRIVYKESIAQSIISDLATFGFISVAGWFSKDSVLWSMVTALFFLFFIVMRLKEATKSSSILYFYSHEELKKWVDQQGGQSMIKRYGLGPKKLGGAADTSIYGPDIVEMKDGDYVRYEDYIEIIDAIGAGGVKGQLMRKELSDDAVEEIRAMAAIQLVNGKAELTNVREIAHAITREVTRGAA